MKNSGAFGTDKLKVLEKVDPSYLPKQVFISKNDDVNSALRKFSQSGLCFPVVIKPNVGERGRKVEKIDSSEDLEGYFRAEKNYAYGFLIQEFIDFSLELGILFYSFPKSRHKGITSVTLKKFLIITGDGKRTLYELLKANCRAAFRMSYFKEKLKSGLENIPPKGANLLLEPIGNHNRGTVFLDANFLINNRLVDVFANISKTIEGFQYGRYDIKVKSIDDLFLGKNIKIMEINGVNSEPAHIYDPTFRLKNAYKTIFFHMDLIAKISHENKSPGNQPVGLFTFLKDMSEYLKNRS